MGATFGALKTWNAQEILTGADLNASIAWLLANQIPAGMDDLSTTVAEMRQETDPGAQGSESQATSLAGEIQRLRYAIRRIIGETYWYDAPNISLAETNTQFVQISGLPANRIVSGAIRGSGSNQPAFILPNGATNSCVIDATPTNLVVRINDVSYTFSADITVSGLVQAPASNNTALVNDVELTNNYFSQLQGEWRALTIDTVGTEITALVGKYAGFKIVHGGNTEYFLGYVKSSTEITDCRRGYFFNSSYTPISRVTIADNDTITLMKLTWIFLKTDGTVDPVYTNPTYSQETPSSPALGDYWFDTENKTWKRFNGSTWASAGAHLIGITLQDSANCVAARAFDFYASYSDLNTILFTENSATQVRAGKQGGKLNVTGSVFEFSHDDLIFDITTHRDSGVGEAASTMYYLYITDAGKRVVSDVYPYLRPDLAGCYYHPYNPWRMVGLMYNDGSQNIICFSSVSSAHLDRNQFRSANGFGSTNTRIRRFVTIQTQQSARMLIRQSATLGDDMLCYFPTSFHTYARTNNTAGAYEYDAITQNATAAECAANWASTAALEAKTISSSQESLATSGNAVAGLAGGSTCLPGDIIRMHSGNGQSFTNDAHWVMVGTLGVYG